MPAPSTLIILAEGAEDMETVISADVLRRGKVDVTVAGLDGTDAVTCGNKTKIQPDIDLVTASKSDYDVVLCPGGMGGTYKMMESPLVGEILKRQEGRGKYIAAICAAPMVLKTHGICSGKKLTSHPAVKDKMTDGDVYKYIEERVVVDDKLVTSRAPGTAAEFALKLVELLQGEATATEVAAPMYLK